MPTVKDYLQLIPDVVIRERALRNLHVERAGDQARSLEHAVFTAFVWHRTGEGYKYWYDYYVTLPGHSPLIKPPK